MTRQEANRAMADGANVNLHLVDGLIARVSDDGVATVLFADPQSPQGHTKDG